MPRPEAYSFRRYLAAKRTVDERAVNRRVRDRLGAELAELEPPVSVLEVGVGIGATVERLAAWDAFPGDVAYTAVDVEADLLQATRERLLALEKPSFEPLDGAGRLVTERAGRRFEVELVDADVFDFVETADRPWDLLVGQAFLDLYDVRSALDHLGSAVAPGGLLYFPITFDGGTVLEPPVDPSFDDAVERRYHDHMDRVNGGDSRAGRHLLTALPELGGRVLAAGASDWVVVPDGDGYPADEAYFLHHLVETIRGALAEDQHLDSDRFDEWIAARHRQIAAGELVYVAHQLDVLGRAPP